MLEAEPVIYHVHCVDFYVWIYATDKIGSDCLCTSPLNVYPKTIPNHLVWV